ncbi:MAG TPA: ABC transporter permease subunit [Candidatus Hydrogenedentes bacterium]|nr:ABC transporter permease subunit [Candidatus Hydrogenedentota bacterium]
MMFPSTAIIRRDLLRAARQKRTFLWVLVLVGMTSFFVIAYWPRQSYYFLGGGRVSENIIIPSMMTWMFAVMILVTPYGATAIVLERQRETFDLLRTTRIRPLGFVFAQLLSVVSLQLVLLLTTLPVVASIYFLVGLELRNLIIGVGMVLVTMVSCAVMGLYASSKSQSVLTAFVRAYLYAFTVMGGPVLVGVVLVEVLNLYRIGSRFEEVLAAASPPFAGIAASIGEVQPESVVVCAIIQCVVILFGLALVYRNVLRPDTGASPWWEILASDLIRPFRRARDHGRLYSGKRAGISDYANPVYVKDTHFVGRGHRSLLLGMNLLLLAVAALIGIPAFFVALTSNNVNREEALVTWVVFMWFALGILAPLTTATSIANEHELGNLDMLRVTRLRGRDVVLGKFLAGCRLLVSAVIVLAVGSLLLAPLDSIPRMQGGLVTGFFSACLAGLMGVSMGILASSFARTSTRAVIWAYILTAWMLILMFLYELISYELLSEMNMAPGRGHPFTEAAFETTMFLSPPLAYIRNWDEHSPPDTLVTAYWLAHAAFQILLNSLIVWAACIKMTSRWRPSEY